MRGLHRALEIIAPSHYAWILMQGNALAARHYTLDLRFHPCFAGCNAQLPVHYLTHKNLTSFILCIWRYLIKHNLPIQLF
jgi:hypothetical protein